MTHRESSARIVLILGANGRLGRATVTAFAARGWRVIAQARHALGYPLPPGARLTTAALDGGDELAREARGAAAIVYAINMPYPRWARDAVPVARRAMDLAIRLDAALLFPGNVYNFGAGMAARLAEDAPQQPTTSFGAIRCQLEDELAARPGLRSAVLRAGDYFGAGSGAWFDQVITRSLARGTLVYPGPLDRPHAWAYLPDLAQVFVALAERELPAFSRWHFAGHTLTGAACLAGIAEAAAELGLAPARGMRHGELPWRMIRLGGLVVPMWRAIAQLSYLWHVPHELDDTALRAFVGPLPTTPWVDAVRCTLRELTERDAETAAIGAGLELAAPSAPPPRVDLARPS